MARHLAVVDTDEKAIYIEYEGCVTKYHLGMYFHALENPKYWEDAEIESNVDSSIPELLEV